MTIEDVSNYLRDLSEDIRSGKVELTKLELTKLVDGKIEAKVNYTSRIEVT